MNQELKTAVTASINKSHFESRIQQITAMLSNNIERLEELDTKIAPFFGNATLSVAETSNSDEKPDSKIDRLLDIIESKLAAQNTSITKIRTRIDNHF